MKVHALIQNVSSRVIVLGAGGPCLSGESVTTLALVGQPRDDCYIKIRPLLLLNAAVT